MLRTDDLGWRAVHGSGENASTLPNRNALSCMKWNSWICCINNPNDTHTRWWCPQDVHPQFSPKT